MTLTPMPRHRAASGVALPLSALAGFATVDGREPSSLHTLHRKSAFHLKSCLRSEPGPLTRLQEGQLE